VGAYPNNSRFTLAHCDIPTHFSMRSCFNTLFKKTKMAS